MREDWVYSDFNTTTKIIAGTGFPKNIQGQTIGHYAFYKVGDISKNVQAGYRFLKICDNYVNTSDIINIKGKLIPKGSVVFAKIGEALKLNRRAITNSECLIDNNVVALKANDYILDNLYLYFYLLTIRLDEFSRATTVPSVRKSDIEDIKLPLPPLLEQKAIVAKIEQLFSELDNGVVNLKTAKAKLKIYRQAVLKKAFEGFCTKLTTIGDEFNFIGGGTPSKNNLDFWNGTIHWASVKDIKGDYLNTTIDFITEKGVKNSATNVAKKGDVILATRISVGKTIITNIETAINQDLKIVKPINEYSNKYTHYLFKLIERKIINLSSGTTVLGINLNNLKQIEIPNNSLEEQKQIVQEIESRLSVCDKIEETIETSLAKSEALRQSILKKAFEGKILSEQELENIKNNPEYESAEALLTRIKKERSK